MQAIRVHQHGGPDVLYYDEAPMPTPGVDEVVIQVEFVGVNYIDVYQRTGLYPGILPLTPGVEAAGVVTQLGENVTEVREGDRVAYVGPQGAYAQYAVVPARQLVSVPEGLDLQQAAAAMLQGMTAHYLVHGTYPVQSGDYVLVHAAAGGTGQLIVQMAKQRGATVFGTTSTEEKATLVRTAGADDVILYTQTDFATEVKRLTDNRGVHVVYDSVGKTTFDKSLDCLRPRGTLALFGQSSGPVPPFDPAILNAKGSLYLTRPSLFHYIAERSEMLERANAVLQSVLDGTLKLRIDHTFPLAEAAEAHRRLEGRATTGKLLLAP